MSPLPSHRVSSSADGIEPGSTMKAEQHQVHHTNLGHAHSAAMTISPELFEKLYLQPKIRQYSRQANPTPMGLVGFVISTFTFSMILMGWGGASGFPAVVGIFFFVGPLMLTLAAIFNWIMGNFYPVCATILVLEWYADATPDDGNIAVRSLLALFRHAPTSNSRARSVLLLRRHQRNRRCPKCRLQHCHWSLLRRVCRTLLSQRDWH